MGFEPGKDYAGLTAADYAFIVSQGIDEINEWLEDNMLPVQNGAYYVYEGDQFEMIEQLEFYDFQGYVNFFIYLRSTWQIKGF